MSGAHLKELAEDPTLVMPLTVEQFHRMVQVGILEEGEPLELLDGLIVRTDRSARGADPMTVGNHHAWAVDKLIEFNARLRRAGCYLRPQQPLPLPPHSEPQPDGLVVVGTPDRYRERPPRAADVLCVIEVADASLRRDRITKLRIYAGANIPRYVIINLPDVVVEVYTDPLADKGRYATTATLRPGQKLELPTASGKPLTVPVRSLLP